jgi:pyridoxal phosphate enzyme (YggS family)
VTDSIAIPASLQWNIGANLAQVDERIAAACRRAGRDRSEVTLVAVTKTRSLAEIIAAYCCGVRHFGENRIEEAAEKAPALRATFGPDPVTWHMIGHVQSRKARDAAHLADVVHSVDSTCLATRLDRFAGEAGKRLPVLLEANVSGEESKYGFPAWDEAGCTALLDAAREVATLPNLDARGLMTMAPIVADPEEARLIFARLRNLREALRDVTGRDWPELSMGMTDDYVVAVEEGATMVRIGRAIFTPSTPNRMERG